MLQTKKNTALLVIIIVLLMINFTRLLKVQLKCNSLSQIDAGQLYDAGVLSVGQIQTKWLTILDDKNEMRMAFHAHGDTSSIDVFDADGNRRLDFFDKGPGEKAALKLYSTDGACIELSTHGHSPLISITDKAKKVTRFGSGGMF